MAAGFALVREVPVLTCDADALTPLPAPDGFEVGLAETIDDHLGTLLVGHEAYAETGPPPGPVDAEQRMAFAREGGLVVLARASGGEPAASAVCEPPYDGVTELAAVGTRTAFRRRGLTGAVTSASPSPSQGLVATSSGSHPKVPTPSESTVASGSSDAVSPWSISALPDT